ncbi:AarF/ABC1/UbiB kinase family protein [Amycolatopsis sp. 195334CR]|uniref:ABC1 kinase family protein n=1 Tax=Amycolatopsis sp. 195334CR TaxID=2814588 RepID=UPI001A8F238E|nr:AarF/ABC1/UbiB kinase family protein [Amycolatopsis sp. 195334CR]MBN6040595.1 AarF/ABC1/UbiB kinase family protein [Amycolatopsis sp. 195334CR]
MSELPTGRLKRALPLAALTGRTAGGAVVAALQGGQRREAARERAAGRYAELLGRSRGVLMKAGQLLSFLSLDPGGSAGSVQEAFSRLQSGAPAMPWAETSAVLTAELDGPLERHFAEFDTEPLAAASIGQVHRARLPGGREVAVKVQYPGIGEAIRADLANVELLTAFLRVRGVLSRGMPAVDTRALIGEIAGRIGEEVDYRAEARHQRRFAAAYAGHPFIRVPAVLPELSTGRVLTTELADGLPWAEATGAAQDLRDRWGEVVFRFLWGSLRELGVAYADPHPGNYLFHPDGSVTFLDFGCVKEFEPDRLAQIVALQRAGAEADAEGVWRASLALGSLREEDGPSPAELHDWMSAQFLPLTAEQPFTYTREHAAALNRRMFSPFGPYGAVLKQLTMPPHTLFHSRMDTGVTAILGALRSTADWAAVLAELDGLRPPATELGELAAGFRAGRA